MAKLTQRRINLYILLFDLGVKRYDKSEPWIEGHKEDLKMTKQEVIDKYHKKYSHWTITELDNLVYNYNFEIALREWSKLGDDDCV